MKEIIEKIEEAARDIKSASDHSTAMFFIFIVSLCGCIYASEINTKLEETNKNLRQILMELSKQDTVYIHEK